MMHDLDAAPAVSPLSRWVFAPAVAVMSLLLAVSGRYGFHRDELYFIESARHPAWGYVDNPPLTPFIGWLSRQLFGDSLFGLRVLPALEIAILVVVVAAIAREIGAGKSAQILAGVVTATSSFVLGIGHLLTTPTFDLLAAATVAFGLCRIVRSGEQRWWLLIGAAIGFGMENKYTLALFVVALAIGVLLTNTWRVLLSRWTVIGAAIAILIWLPQLLWQIDHGWPQLSFARTLAREDGTVNRATLLPFQLLVLGPPLLPILLAGIVALWHRKRWRALRFFPLGYVVLLVALAATGGKGYYAADAFPVLIAAGSIATVDWVKRSAGARRTRSRLLLTGLVVNCAVGAIITLPLLPQSATDGMVGAVNPDSHETVGWPSFVDQVATAVRGLDERERSTLVIFTENYGEAGAIDRYGQERGLPHAFSGHNSYADFGVPPGSAGPILVVGYDDVDRDYDRFTGCSPAGTIHTVDGIDNDENGTELWLCAAPAKPWSELWPSLRREG